MRTATMYRWDLEQLAEESQDWRERATDAELKVNALIGQKCALHARCSELLALFKLHERTPTGDMVIEQTEALLRITK